MQFQDPVRWSDQEIELQADESSRLFLKFFIDWFTLAEKLLKPSRIEDSESQITVITAARLALAETEADHGALSMEWIGQMLLLAREHWCYGKDLMTGLTRLEMRMVEQMEAVKLAELAESATL